MPAARCFRSDYSPVAVVVPAYNEEKVIVQTITSLLACDHPRQFEIIVVDDGSSDATYRVASETFAADPRVRVYTRPNGGSRRRSILAWRRPVRRSCGGAGR